MAFNVPPDGRSAQQYSGNEQEQGNNGQNKGDGQLLHLPHGKKAEGRHQEQNKKTGAKQHVQHPVAQGSTQGDLGKQKSS